MSSLARLPQAARRTVATGLAVVVAAVCLGQTSSLHANPADATPVPAKAPSADDAVDYVVAISVDGLNPSAIRRLGRVGAPSFYRLIDSGAWTLNARTSHERTITLPNHTGMLTGRHVLGTGGHHITVNADNGSTVHRSAGGYVRGIFDVVHNRDGSTAFYSAKDKFNLLDRSWNGGNGAPDVVGRDTGLDKIDRYHLDDERSNVTRLVKRLHTAPDELSFVHLAYPDRAGHAHGFMSPTYLRAVRAADTQLGRILDAVRADARLRQHANVVLTADHGGRGKDHSDRTKAANYVVPFMAWGVGVAKGADLYTLNATTRQRPGTGRTTYAGKQPIRNAEVANLVADLLDMRTVPGSQVNTRQDLSVR